MNKTKKNYKYKNRITKKKLGHNKNKSKKVIGGTKEQEFLDTLFNSIVFDMQNEKYFQIEQALILYPDIVNYKINVDGSESNLLQQAIAIKNTIVLDLLITYGANVNDKTRNIKPLVVATVLDCEECAGLLLTNGADVNTTDEYGRTCLVISIQTNYLNIFQLLLDFGANIFMEDDEGKTALTYAACYANELCLKKL